MPEPEPKPEPEPEPKPEPHDEQRLLELLQAGDEKAAEQVFNDYAARLLDLARQRISQRLARRIDPEDVVQSVFRTFFRRAREGRFVVEGPDDLCRILAGITARKALRQVAYQRAAKRDPGLESQAGPDVDKGLSELCAPEPSPAAEAAFLDHLEYFLRRLRPTDRTIVEMRLNGYTTEEIAKELGLSDRHVRRGLQHIRTIAEQDASAHEE